MKKGKQAAAVIALAAAIGVGTQWQAIQATWSGEAYASSAGTTASVGTVPGTADDPVVTKSYVDQKIAEALKGGAVAPTSTPSPTQSPTSAPTATPGSSAGGSTDDGGIKVINVPAGKTLIAADGAEVVVRGGKAVAYSPDSNGIADVTDGVDIKSGASVPQNHLILFPRGGRGVGSAEGMKTGLTVMVRGAYEIKTIEK
ncbi:hypothetical protein HGI30_21210 [Paenibacillus albicereus]|uniref:Uncharacterized protein n=1 Tax=Paenibacillus albicereus TaxID=2726185 RepID=A0A6H2H274_9BACL|nr:hypothetical protein [Paenibacillus albicereus]QJC53793.1 hypothetical protein HGI30_21210 [Paenibacillus albicereus]